MEYYFGAHRAKAVFMPALESKMDQVNASCKDIELVEDENFIKIRVDSLNGAAGESLCGVLFDVIEQVGQPRYLALYLNRHYDFLSEEVRCSVLINTLKELWFCEDIFLRGQIMDRIKQYLQEESDTLLIDGFIDFRLKEFRQFWRNKVDENISKCFARSEYDEFIDLLRAYVNLRPASADLVHILQRDDEYLVLDEAGKAIDLSEMFEEDDMRTVEDEVFSALLAIAPSRIIFHKCSKTNAMFLKLVQSVFECRVHVVE